MDRLAALTHGVAALYSRLVAAVEAALEPWLLGLLARLIFAAVLFGYYWNAALTKIEPGLLGWLQVRDAAYWQMLPPVVEAYGYDVSAVPTLPWGLIVGLGTYAEFLLPVLIVAGLATRVAAAGMIAFVLVQSYVDIAFHGVDDATVGALFDRHPGSAIMDQRTLWVFLLAYLVVKGAGLVSLDALLRRRIGEARDATPARA
ncbi:DoxX family protein [Rubrimonas sp.]|uniref:DoxX family protein n=1 Tax=Rubrimonas sp. TaxID=2036015 RepID=UPI002FDCAE5E